MSHESDYDVAVVGGGPSGSTLAGLLAKRGHRVIVLEKQQFPRYHVGESLITGLVPVMEELGIVPELDRLFRKKYGITLRWGNEPDPWRTAFNFAGPYEHSWHVTRSEFDQLLLRRAQELGADVIEGAAVSSPVLDDGGRCCGVNYSVEGDKRSVSAPWVVDASGQARNIARKMTDVEWQKDLRNVALWTYFSPYEGLGGDSRLDIFCESVPGHGWFWAIPISESTLSVGQVQPVENLRDTGGAGGYKSSSFEAGLKASSVVKSMVDFDNQTSQFRTARDWSHVCDRFYGSGWVTVGDAAAFIDPLFSSGVWLGTSGAWLAARALDAVLQDQTTEGRALERFESVYKRLFYDILTYVRYFYNPNRELEDYFQKAAEATKAFSGGSQVGFVSLISGITALPDLVGFDPVGEEGFHDLVRESVNSPQEQATTAG